MACARHPEAEATHACTLCGAWHCEACLGSIATPGKERPLRTCPDCGGALWEIQEGRVLRYQCHVGHQYAPENLEQGQLDEIAKRKRIGAWPNFARDSRQWNS